MANPFDQFDSHTEGNPFDQFDSPEDKKKYAASQIPGTANSADGSRNVGVDDSTWLDKARGLAEAGAATVTGIPATLAEGWGQLLGAEPGKVSEHFYQPRTEKGKEYTEAVGEFTNRYLNPLLGGLGSANFNPKGPKALKGSDNVVNTVKEKQAAIDAAKVKEANPFDKFDVENRPGSEIDVNLNMPEVMAVTPEGQGIVNSRDALYRQDALRKQADEQSLQKQQGELFPPEEQPRGANPYEAQQGMWVTDENGMPIRADLSMEVQNLQNPLQRNLWGDELAAREIPEGQSAKLPMDRDVMGFEKMSQDPRKMMENELGMTQALDKMPDHPWRSERDTAVDLLKGEIEASGELKAAKMAAESAFSKAEEATPRRDPFKGPGRRQAGAIDPSAIMDGIDTLAKLVKEGVLKPLGDSLQGVKVYRAIADGESKVGPRKEGSWVTPNKDIAQNVYAKGDASRVVEDYIPKRDLYEAHPDGWIYAPKGTDISGVKRTDTLTFGEMANKNSIPRMPKPSTGYVPLKQRGAIWLGERRQQQLERVMGRDNMIPDNPNVPEGLKQAHVEKDAKQWVQTESGATLAAMKRGSTAVRMAAQLIQNAGKQADLKIRNMVLPVEKAFRGLSKEELAGVANVLKEEMLANKRFSPNAIEQMSAKQQIAYAHMRALFEDTLKIQNEARAAKGQKPITEMEAYLSSRWEGSYRRPIFQAILNKDGSPRINEKGEIEKKLVWYLASDTKRGLEKQADALRKDHPDLLIDPKNDHTIRHYKKQTDLQSAYSTMIDVLGRDDPAVEAVRKVVEQQTVNEGASFLGQEKHFKYKAGIRGFVGDRPGHEGFKENLAMIQQQIQYAKNAYNWSEIQKSSGGIKEILSDPLLKENQPNNVQYIRQYFKNAIGHGEAAAVAHMADAMRDLGWNIDAAGKYIDGTKTFFILQKLGVSTGNAIVNMLQSANILPHLMSREFGGSRANIPMAIAVGVPGGIAMGTGHFINYLRGARDIPVEARNFYLRAFKYAEDNGITARSIYDESPIESSFSTTGRVANAVGKTISTPEVLTRSIAYMTAVQFLKDSHKFTKEADVFQRAEEMVNAAMVDYRRAERPMAFSKLGQVGNALSTLQTYPMNWYNQWNYFAREGMKGNIAPFMSALALQYALAGAMGIPGVGDMDKLYQFIKNHLPADYYSKVQGSDFWSDPKLWALKNFGTSSVYGWLSDKTGIGMTTRLQTPGMEDMLQAPAGPFVDVAKQVGHAANAVVNPNRDTIAQAAMASAPVGLQGLVEHAPAFQGSTFEKTPDGRVLAMRPGNIASHTNVYTRDEGDVTLRKFGLRSTKEMAEREINYRQSVADKVSKQKAQDIPEMIYAASKVGNTEKVRELTEAYVKLQGSEMTAEKWQALVERNFLDVNTRKLNNRRQLTPAELLNFMRANAAIQKVREDQSK